jgi:Zn-dependent M28 family amino/carboxypeptidase
MSDRRRRRSRYTSASGLALLAAAALALVALVVPAAAPGAGTECQRRVNNTYTKLLECVTLEGVRAHQGAFQEIASANDDEFYPGTRATGTEGYDNSVTYVKRLLRDAGYQVQLDEFTYDFIFPAVLDQLTPVAASYETGAFTNSGFGDVTAAVAAVDINLVPPRASTSGCEAGDFAGFPAGAIALIQRGTCAFADKAMNAKAAGASAVIIFNQGNTPDREGLIIGTLAPAEPGIAVVGASFADGAALAQAGSTAHVVVVEPEERTAVNVIADLKGKNRDNIVMAGAHLDSVVEGPGINDNGSGSAALLETALQMAKVNPENTLRFAWWGAEELGLIGSTEYVAGLTEKQREKIALYMNYDMIGSPNYVQMVYDADESTFPAPVVIPPGSTAIEDLYESYYTLIGEPYDDAEFSGRSDYEAFINVGIPSGGLFTGAEEPKSAEQAAIWGGTVGEQLDPCYHIACDTFANFSAHALGVNSDLVAFAQLTFAYSTEAVNGVQGRKVPDAPVLPPPAGPEGTWD